MADEAEEEDDYLSMSFADTSHVKETSLQRTARLKKEGLERGKLLSKKELAEQERLKREVALATELDSSNKGAQMMAKMGFKGGALGRSEDARTRPIELHMKDDRGGIGMDSDKKRKIREAAAAMEDGEKRQKVGLDEFRERNRTEREEKRTEGLMWGAMKVFEKFETEVEDDPKDDDQTEKQVDGEDKKQEDPTVTNMKQGRLRDVNALYRPLLRQRLERELARKMRYEVNNAFSTRNDDEDEEGLRDNVFDRRAEDLDDEDPELEEFEALSAAERLEKIVHALREKYHYCYWCKYRYPDAEMDGCPGVTEDEHG